MKKSPTRFIRRVDNKFTSASLDLNFQNMTTSGFDSRITFTRASSGTFFNGSGILQTASNDVARFDHNPLTGESLGLLIEEQRTNLLTYSEEFDNLVWVSGGSGTINPNTAIAPNGTLTADEFTTTGGAGSRYQSATVSQNTTYTFTVYIKLGTMVGTSYKIAIYNNTAGNFIAQDVVPTQTVTSTNWTRISYSFTTPAGCVSVRVYPFRNGSALPSSTVFFWGAQLEAGAFPTSYIPTTVAAATRNADVATMTGTNFSSWYNATEGTLYSEAQITGGTLNCIASIDDNTTNNRFQIRRLTTSASFRFVSAGGSIDAVLPGGPAFGVNKTVGTVKASDQQAANNGALFTGITSVSTMPTVDRLQIGAGPGSNNVNGYIRRIAYYPVRLSNDQLQALTR